MEKKAKEATPNNIGQENGEIQSKGSDVNPQDQEMKAMLIESQKKSVLIAYLLLSFGNLLGAHRFYLGSRLAALAYPLVLFGSVILGFFNSVFLVGFIIYFVMVLLDLIFIPGRVRRYNNRLTDGLS